MAAGCLFTDGKHVLAGLQQKNGNLVLSGFGGKIEPTDECTIDAAIRETLEELFHIEVPPEIVRYIMVHNLPQNQFQNGDYRVHVYSFWDLVDFLHICQGFGVVSPLYDSIPTDILSLIQKRKILPEAEIKELSLLPMYAFDEICEFFKSDLRLLVSKL
jgi:hypothetical protein